MLTMSKQFGSVADILIEAMNIAKMTGHSIEFEFNGVWVNVPPNTDKSELFESVRTIIRMVNSATKHKVYL